jgi:hypothetical protein
MYAVIIVKMSIEYSERVAVTCLSIVRDPTQIGTLGLVKLARNTHRAES